MKPKLKMSLTPQFVIPAPFKAWCHYCGEGFMSIDEIQQHDKDKINKHQGAR